MDIDVAWQLMMFGYRGILLGDLDPTASRV